jgi:hypothetical protein
MDITRLHYPSMKDAMLEFNIDLQDTLIHDVNWYKEHVGKEDSKISMTGYAQCPLYQV